MNNNVRNITIGLIDGLTIPFALAAGMSSIVLSSHIIFVSCVVVVVAYSITMGIGAYMSVPEHESGSPLATALVVGLSYIAGGFMSVFSFLILQSPATALRYATAITLSALFVAGYFDSKLNNANGWKGAFRVVVTGAVAGAAAYGVGGLFK